MGAQVAQGIRSGLILGKHTAGRVLLFAAAACLFWWLLFWREAGSLGAGVNAILDAFGRYISSSVAIMGWGAGEVDPRHVDVVLEVGSHFANTIMLAFGGLVLAFGVAMGGFLWSVLRRGSNVELGGGIISSVFRLPAFVVGLLLAAVLTWIGWGRLGMESRVLQYVLCLVSIGIGGGMVPDLLRILSRAWSTARGKEYVQMARVRGDRLERHVWREILAPVLDYAFSRMLYILGGVIAVEYLLRYPGIGYLTIANLLECPGGDSAVCLDKVYLGVLVVMLTAFLTDSLRRMILRWMDPRYGEEGSR